MNSKFGHVVLGVKLSNLPFYQELFSFLGWKTVYAGEEMLGIVDTNGISLWFGQPLKDVANDYDGPGINHLAISVAEQGDVDAAVSYLQERGIAALFETPRHRAEFSHGPDHTYYQVMFESPDRILFEIVYTGALAK
jgi:catechol 2,3-dioxygenase-like lactoylglutathione lyase family enzyme